MNRIYLVTISLTSEVIASDEDQARIIALDAYDFANADIEVEVQEPQEGRMSNDDYGNCD